jgi:Flp pilus assembly pilin Flp
MEKLIHWLSLDTDEGVTAIEYAVIVGLVVGGILSWALH